jgi:hypothetical protein
MCVMNSEPKQEFYCHNCKRLVTAEEAGIVCWTSGHDVENGEDDLFSGGTAA